MTVLILVVSITVLVSALCSLFEATLYSTRQAVLEAEAGGGRRARAAGRMLDLKKNVAEPTSAILILNTVANTAGAAVAGMVAAQALGPGRVPAFSAVLTLLILLFAEIIPKTVGAVSWRAIWPYVVWPITLLRRVMHPAVWLTRKLADLLTGGKAHEAVTEEEIQAVIRMGGAAGELSAGELQLLTNVFHFDETFVRQVMLPRREIVFIDVDTNLAECLDIVHEARHTRYPVCDGSLDNLLGLVHIKDLIGIGPDAPFDLRKVMRPLRTVPDTLPISKLLRQMQTLRQHMVAVSDEYGSLVGLITLENIIEQLIGSVRDEFDEETPDIIPEQEGVYKVRGGLPLDRINRELSLDLTSEEIDSISGLVTEQMGRMLRTGDEVTLDGDVRAEVLDTEGGRAMWVRLKLPEARE
ncbi:MAG: hemolysin family protein [Bryobacterales bacterium]